MAQAHHIDASAALADLLVASLSGPVAMSARPRREAPLRILTGVNMPAALVEIAYLTNTEQERLAQSEAYQNTVAQAIYDAVLQFRAYLEEQRAP